MKPTQTGIAVALALIVIAVFFIFPGLSPFAMPSESEEASDITINQTATSTMPTDSTNQLQIVDTIIGTGDVAQAGDQVTVHYVGSFTDGTVFDASASHPESANGFTFPLGGRQVIQGWDEGVAGMKVGGKRHLVIPSDLAYGPQGRGSIPPNATLVFDVELLKVVKGTH